MMTGHLRFVGLDADQQRILQAMVAEQRRCRTCMRVLEVMDGTDNVGNTVLTWMLCPTLACRQRFRARTFTVGCGWRTIWTEPDAIAAVAELHNRVCSCAIARLARDEQ